MRYESLATLCDSGDSSSILGFLDTRACIMFLRCSYSEYQRDYRILADEMRCCRNMRVFFHELTHYIQLNTTPVGFYLSLLEDYQASQLRNILKYIPDARLPIINDLIRYHDVNKCPEAWFYLRKWYAAELMLCIFSGNFRRFQCFASPTVFQDESVPEIFGELDYDIARHMKFRWGVKSGGLVHNPPIYPNQLYRLENSPSVLENHARMSEFWWDAIDISSFASRIQRDTKDYAGWIKRYLQVRKIGDVAGAVGESIAMSELALFSPVLPWVSSFSEQSFLDMVPTYRMLKMLESVKDVRPLNGINDYNRFVDEMGQRVNFTPVKDVCDSTLSFTVLERRTSYWVDLFYKATERRKDNFSLFHNLGLWHPLAARIEPFSVYFTKEFSPPMICFLDVVREKKTGYGANAGNQMLIRFLYRAFCKAAMTGFCKHNDYTVSIKSPLPANSSEKEYIENQTNLYISEQLRTNYRIILD